MKFTIQGKPIDMVVTSVVLEACGQDDLEGLKLWHCPIDNTPLFQYSGRQVMIVPGKVPTKLPLIAQCSKCHTKYLVVSVL